MCENCLCEEGDRRREERKLATFKCCCPWVWRETGLPPPFFLGSLSISKCYAFYLLHNLLLFLPLTTFKNSYLPQRRRLQSQNPPIPPLNRGWSRAKAKTRHFPLLDLGVEGEECNFPIHYVQDCRLVKDDTKSLWFSYVKGCYYTHKHNTSPILLFFFCRLTYDDAQRLVVESKATNVRSDGTPFLAMILCSKRFDPEKGNEKHIELIT